MIDSVEDDGRITLTAFDGDVRVGSLWVIVREVPRNGQVFATKADARDPAASRELIAGAMAYARAAGAAEIRLGVAPAQRDRWDLDDFLPVYDSLELDFPIDRAVPDPELTLVPVTDDTAEAWRDVINRSFADSPNGSTESPEDVARMRAEPGSELLLGHRDGRPALAAHVVTSDGAFFVESLGVAPEARGAGLGRALLRALLHHAKAHGATRISLMVMDGNARAYGLYLAEGFTRTRVVSHWFRRELAQT